MRYIIYLFCILSHSITYSQNTPSIDPYYIGIEFDFSDEFISKFNSEKSLKYCDSIYNTLKEDGRDIENATNEELAFLKYCNEYKESVWDPVGGGCSWYCGGVVDSITCSSYLSEQSGINYHPKNAHDFNYKSVWVEGSKGNGIGESLTYHFPANLPRITSIIIANGYVKNKTAWLANSRVKKLKVYWNDNPLAILNLKDIRAEQKFRFEPIGYTLKLDNDKLKIKDQWTLRFEILDIYPGIKYEDVVISEIFFDGIDVH